MVIPGEGKGRRASWRREKGPWPRGEGEGRGGKWTLGEGKETGGEGRRIDSKGKGKGEGSGEKGKRERGEKEIVEGEGKGTRRGRKKEKRGEGRREKGSAPKGVSKTKQYRQVKREKGMYVLSLFGLIFKEKQGDIVFPRLLQDTRTQDEDPKGELGEVQGWLEAGLVPGPPAHRHSPS